MSFCPNCGANIEEGLVFCPNCGASLAAAAVPAKPVYDHTAEFAPEDVSKNKPYCMLIYLMSTVGIIIALLAGKDSPYAQFHIREGIKLAIVNILLILCAAVLCWTIIVPIVAGLATTVIFVLRVIAFFQICNGKAVETAIIRDLKFLK